MPRCGSTRPCAEERNRSFDKLRLLSFRPEPSQRTVIGKKSSRSEVEESVPKVVARDADSSTSVGMTKFLKREFRRGLDSSLRETLPTKQSVILSLSKDDGLFLPVFTPKWSALNPHFPLAIVPHLSEGRRACPRPASPTTPP